MMEERPDYFILDAEGCPLATDPETWARWYKSAERRVAVTGITDDVTVSTVFLGLDHRYVYETGDELPLLWETLVFGGVLDGQMVRYETLGSAREGHDAMVVRVCAAEGVAVQNQVDLMGDVS